MHGTARVSLPTLISTVDVFMLYALSALRVTVQYGNIDSDVFEMSVLDITPTLHDPTTMLGHDSGAFVFSLLLVASSVNSPFL